jgi:uncharacterized protein
VREEAQRIAGRLEGTLRIPDARPGAIVVVAHPLPTHGGSMRNPLMAFLARSAAERGWYALRFNFRGVGESAGTWSGGREEPEDLADAAAHARALAPGLPLAVVGFSFGARMLARWLASGGRADAHVFLGLPLRSATGADDPPERIPSGSLVVNGEHDVFGMPEELREVYPDARVVEISGTDHFFNGKRDEVARVAMEHIALAVP